MICEIVTAIITNNNFKHFNAFLNIQAKVLLWPGPTGPTFTGVISIRNLQRVFNTVGFVC